MTPKHAKAIYYLTSLTEWDKLNEHWQAELDKLHESLESCRKEDLEKIQAEIVRLKDCLKLRGVAEVVLESEK